MWLLDKMLNKLIQKGELHVTNHDGKTYQYGVPDDKHGPVYIKLTDRKAAFDIAKDPRVGAGETFMDGRLVPVKGSDVRDLILLIQYNAPFENLAALEPKGFLRKAVDTIAGRLDQINWKTRSRSNAEHTYNLTRRLYELFLDADRQYTMAYYRDTSDSLEKAQLDKISETGHESA